MDEHVGDATDVVVGSSDGEQPGKRWLLLFIPVILIVVALFAVLGIVGSGQDTDQAVDARTSEVPTTTTSSTVASSTTTETLTPETSTTIVGSLPGSSQPLAGGTPNLQPATGGGGSYTPPPPPPPVETYIPPAVSWTITSCSYQPLSPRKGTVVVNWTSNVSGGSGWQLASLPTGTVSGAYNLDGLVKLEVPGPALAPVVYRTDTGEPVLLRAEVAPFYSHLSILPTGCAGWN
jgi:hypothetical protein